MGDGLSYQTSVAAATPFQQKATIVRTAASGVQVAHAVETLGVLLLIGIPTTASSGGIASPARIGARGVYRHLYPRPLRLDWLAADARRIGRQPIVITESTAPLGVEDIAHMGPSTAAACSSTSAPTVATAAVIRTGVGGVGPASP